LFPAASYIEQFLPLDLQDLKSSYNTEPCMSLVEVLCITTATRFGVSAGIKGLLILERP
jgi:hypothetical protein